MRGVGRLAAEGRSPSPSPSPSREESGEGRGGGAHAAGEHVEREDAERPPVDRLAVARARQHLGRPARNASATALANCLPLTLTLRSECAIRFALAALRCAYCRRRCTRCA